MTGSASVDLTNCDRERVHIPGSIQPHGCLLALDAEMRGVLRHSVNAAGLLSLPAGNLNGMALVDLLGGQVAHALRNALGRSSGPSSPGMISRLAVGEVGRMFNVSAHAYKGNCIVEFEPADQDDGASPLEIARLGIARVRQIDSAELLLERVPRLVQALLGYDRVMIYRFAEDGSGKVVSEARRNTGIASFLGQHFPASDIPSQARQLYLKNLIRLIGDVHASTVPIEPVLDYSGQPLDLSFAHLRSVSPIHIEYLRNMGVAASMSISIMNGGELWGLIACHHYEPRCLGMARRIAIEMFADVFSLKLEALQQRAALDSAMHARRRLDKLLLDLASHEEVATFMRGRLADFQSLLPADGVGLFMNGTWSGHGSTPPKKYVARLAKFVASVAEASVWASHELSAVFPEGAEFAGEASGVLAIPLSQIPRDYLFFFRREQLQSVEWAGNPDKQYAVGRHGDRLTPRTSFAIWKQEVERQSLPWTPSDRSTAESARIQLLEIILRHSELLASERRKAEIRQKVLYEELNHRVKNILALIKSLVSQPADRARDMTDYVDSLRGRIMALAYAHDQVIRNDGGGALSELVEAELSPYRDGGGDIAVSGPAVRLEARALSVFALVLHEMTTNAAKYGSLSRAGGRLDVRWELEADGDCVLNWSETGGPLVRAPSRQGFGSVLMQRSIPFDLGGTSDVEYHPHGVVGRFVIPAKFVRPLSIAIPAAIQAAAPLPGQAPLLAGRTVLLVEDQLVIALDTEHMLMELGVKSVHTFATAAEALTAVVQLSPDVAVVDINLGSSSSMPVAEELRARNIPFVFATGYGDSAMIPPSLRDVTIVRKPYSVDGLKDGLTAALGGEAPPS